MNETLKEGERSGSDGRHQRLRRVLVVSEFALALTLLAGAGLAMHSFWNLTHVDLGVRTDHILTFGLPVPMKHFAQPQQIPEFYHQLLDKLDALPGVSQADVSTGTPLAGANFGVPFDIVGQPHRDKDSRMIADFQMATPDYYKTFGIQLLQGRRFTAEDRNGSPRAAVVNEFFVHHYLPAGVDPIGQRLLIPQVNPEAADFGPPQEWQIVGVVRDVHMSSSTRQDIFPEIDVPFDQSPWPDVDVAIRTAGDPEAILKSVGAVISSIDPDLPMENVKTMDQLVDQSLLEDRSVTGLFAVFAAAALLLAAIGIYGVISFSVAQRTHEIGLRMALGADRSHVLRLILREGLILALIGLGFGLLGGLFVGRAVQSMLFQVGAIDLPTLCAVAFLLLAAALLASYLPARRAAQLDPMVALRHQ